MPTASTLDDFVALIHFVGPLCQIGTALIAATIGTVTYRFTKRQNALALINQNNSLANLVNTTIIHSEEARTALGKLQDYVVGCPDDAVLFMYLNYVHNTYRMHQIGAVSGQVWRDTLGACVTMVGRLRRDQVARLLARGYEAPFQSMVLAGYDRGASVTTSGGDVITKFRPRHALAQAS